MFCRNVLRMFQIWPLSLFLPTLSVTVPVSLSLFHFHSLTPDMFVSIGLRPQTGHYGDGLDNRHKQRYDEENNREQVEIEREQK